MVNISLGCKVHKLPFVLPALIVLLKGLLLWGEGGEFKRQTKIIIKFYVSHGKITFSLKVIVDSLLIHEFAYSLFIGLCSITSNMIDYSHSYHSIKLIHCAAPQRYVLNDKMVL